MSGRGVVRLLAAAAVTVAACGPPAPAPLPPGSFAFGVYGDGPYYPREQRRYRRVLDDVRRADVEWLIHVGDIFWYPCSDAAYAARRRELDAVGVPVVYTPGDNEWADCHQARPGRHDPLARLASLRRVFFPRPARSLGARPLALESQGAAPAFAEFVENARWTRGGLVFATIHLVGSGNARDSFRGRTPAHDAEVERRTAAAVAWLDATFARARADSAWGVVLAMHGNIGLERAPAPREGYGDFVERLEQRVATFPGAVLLVHGDSHAQRVDHPLTGGGGRPYASFTRLETFGSPDIGWVRVVVDTAARRVTRYEPRLMDQWW